MSISHLGLSVILSCWLAHPALAQKKVPDGAKVFLLSGGQRQHHGYREQALYLSGALENTGRFQVTIGEDAAILETPAMRKYDLLIVTADRRDDEFKFTPGQQEAIFDFVRSGHGYVSIHGADNAPQDWLPPWKEMLGGIYSHVGKPDGKARKGNLHRQDRRHRQPDHPRTERFPAQGRAVHQHADAARRAAPGHDRVSRRRLARRLDPHLRQRPRLSHVARPPRLRSR